MKLIDFLVSSGRGGWKWPNGIGNASCNAGSRDVIFHFDYCPPALSETLISPRNFDAFDIVTREQYEAALTASKTEWDGAFPIPAGTEVEVHFEGDDSRVWTQFRVEYMRGEIIVLYDYRIDSVDAYNNKTLNFRPIHSEEDKKRDEVIASIKAMLMYDYGDDPRLNDAVILYDAIADGKIPHVHID